MPFRQPDDQGIWTYPTVMPGMNAKQNPHSVNMPQLVEAVGLDGRFVGAIRPFPGMGDDTIHGVPTPTAGVTTIESIENILLVKYVSVQKGNSGDTIKGLAILADNQSGTGKALYLAYRDSSDNSTDVIELEDYDSWDDFKLTAINEFDITSMGRYIYVCLSGDTTSNVSQWDGKEPPYNKAYFWDFKINTWDKFVTGFDARFMGLMPRRILGHPINEDNDGSFQGDSSECFEAEVYGPIGHSTPAGQYTYAVELISRKHELRSYLRLFTETALGSSNSGIRYALGKLKLPASGSGFINQIRGNSTILTCLIHWGIPHVDGVRFWRTPQNNTGAEFNEYTIMDKLFLVNEYLEKGVYDPDSSILSLKWDHDSINGTVFNPNPKNEKTTWYDDRGLVFQTQYNAFLHSFHPAPRMKRLAAYDGLLIGVTDVEEPTSPGDDWDDREKEPEAIAWSILTSREPENFPPENQYRPDDAAERFYALEAAGDHLFGVTNAGVYRVTRSGSNVAVNRLQFRMGGVSRWGQTGVGNSLFLVTPSGVKQIDGNTGAINSVASLDRIMLDDSEWAGTLSNVQLEYDGKVGALIIMNTAKKEAYILWESTGAVTKLEDIPWTHLTAGPDILTDGPTRAYFVTDAAQSHVIDGAREMGKRSMCGVTANETMNGTFTAGTNSSTIHDTVATFPANCVSFKVHILSGDLQGESATITVRDSDTQLTVSGFSGTPAVGDRYSVAPVVSRITLPVLAGQTGQADPFSRKVVKSILAAFSDLGGETGSDDTNAKFRVGVKQMLTDLGSVEASLNLVPDKTAAFVNRASTRPFPYLEFKGGNQDWELQGVLVHGVLSISEAQSRQGTS